MLAVIEMAQMMPNRNGMKFRIARKGTSPEYDDVKVLFDQAKNPLDAFPFDLAVATCSYVLIDGDVTTFVLQEGL